MSEQEFDLYLKLLSRCLSLTPGQREQIADELRDHLESRLDELAQTGVPREKAIVQALDEFGDAAVLAANFTAIARLKRRRFLMRLSLGSVGVLTAALLIAYAFWPENRAVRGPEQVVAQEKPSSVPPGAQKPADSKASPSPRPSGLGAGFARSARPPLVEVCHPIAKEVTGYQVFSGHVQPSQFVQIQSQATGYLLKTNFRSGQVVKRGDLLFEIDPAIYQAEADKAAAELGRSEARLEYARTQFTRVQHNFQLHTVSPEEVDKATSERRVAEADNQVARANLELAKVRLSYTHIAAPMSGHIGGTSFGVGSLVKADESVLATITSLNPVYVSIHVDVPTWFALRKRIQRGEFRGSDIPVEVSVEGASDVKRQGLLEFVDDAVFTAGNDPGTTMRVRVPNGDAAFLAGLFVHVRCDHGNRHPALLVPSKALQHVEGESYVWTVSDDNVLRRQVVELVGTVHEGDLFEVSQGLKPDEWLVCQTRVMNHNPDGSVTHYNLHGGMRIEPKRVP